METTNVKILTIKPKRFKRLPPPFSIGFGVGRRKTAVAIVTLFLKQALHFNDSKAPKFDFVINNNVFPQTVVQFNAEYLNKLYLPLKLTGTKDNICVNVIVRGGGISSRIDAIKLALSRALSTQYRKELKMAGLLVTDSRQKERKKYGLKKARKASQYAKR